MAQSLAIENSDETPILETNEPREHAFRDLLGVRIHVSADETRIGTPATIPVEIERFQWRTVPDEERPVSPAEDYYSSDIELSENDLLYRWAGLNRNFEIRQVFKTPYYDRQLERTARQVLAADPVDTTNPEYDQRFSNTVAFLADRQTLQEFELIARGLEIATRKVHDPTRGVFTEEYFRPMETIDKERHVKMIEKLQRISNLAKGKATEIRKVEHSEIDEEKKAAAQRKLEEWQKDHKVNLTFIQVNQSPQPMEPTGIQNSLPVPRMLDTSPITTE